MPQVVSSFAATPGGLVPALASNGARPRGPLEPVTSFSDAFGSLADSLPAACHGFAELPESCRETAKGATENSGPKPPEAEPIDPHPLEYGARAEAAATGAREDSATTPDPDPGPVPAAAGGTSTAPDTSETLGDRPPTAGVPLEDRPDIAGRDAADPDNPFAGQDPEGGPVRAVSAHGVALSAPAQAVPESDRSFGSTREDAMARADSPDGQRATQAATQASGSATFSSDNAAVKQAGAGNRPDPAGTAPGPFGATEARAQAELVAASPPPPAGAAQIEPPRIAGAAPPPITAPPHPTPVISDMRVTLGHATGGLTEVEIALSPAELGNVRLFLSADAAQIGVSVMAERPETLELIRRHVDLLAAELGRLGYDSSELRFSFGQGGSQREPPHPSSAPAEAEDRDQAGPQFDQRNRILSAARLDLRV